MNIVLIGMRGAGKSNVSRRLSVLTKRTVLSSDALIEYENGGQTITDFIVAHKGDWREFRDLEYRVVKKIALMDRVIVDCGGGIIVDLDEDGNEVYAKRKVDALKKKGIIIWLKGDIHTLVEKVKNKAERPALDTARSVEDVMHHRLPFYKKAADRVLDIRHNNRQELAEMIFKTYKNKL